MRQIDRIDRLLAEHVEAGGGDPRLLVGAAEDCERQRRGGPLARAPPLEKPAAVEIGARNVTDEHVRIPCMDPLEAFCGRARALHVGTAVPERGGEHFAIVDLVFDDQDADAVEAWQRRRSRGDVASDDIVFSNALMQRQADREARALSLAGARSDDRSAVHLDDVTRDGETESEAALPVVVVVALEETLEDMRQQRRVNAAPRVDDLDHAGCAVASHADANPSAFAGELDRISEQVPDGLLQSRGVSEDVEALAGAIEREGNLLRLRGGSSH